MWQQLEVSFDLGLTCERLWTEIGSELIISMLGKLSLFHLTVQITELLSTRKLMDLALMRNHFFKDFVTAFLL